MNKRHTFDDQTVIVQPSDIVCPKCGSSVYQEFVGCNCEAVKWAVWCSNKSCDLSNTYYFKKLRDAVNDFKKRAEIL